MKSKSALNNLQSPPSNSGFTLVEIIVSLLLLAILTSLLGMGIVAAVNAYSISRTNVQTAQKAQIAMGRLSRELMSLTSIVKIDNTYPYLIYKTISEKRAMAYSNGTIKLYSNLGDSVGNLTSTDLANNGNVLVDRVSAFVLDYRQAGSAWDQNDIRTLSAIRCSFTLSRNDATGLSETFQTTIHPRNIKSYGGASPDAIPPSRNQYCFIGCLLDKDPAASIQSSRMPKAAKALFIITTAWALAGVFIRPVQRRSNQRGSALLLLIAAMVFFAALGGALVPLISSSGQMFLGTDHAYKAYLLAESGYRYAASRYLNAGTETARNDQLVALHQKSFNLEDKQGGFHLEIYGYFYEVTADPNGSKNLQTRVCGAAANDVSFSSPLKLRIENKTYEFNYASLSGLNSVTFSSPSNLPYVSVGSIALPVADVVQTQQISTGDDIIYESGDGELFPAHNGQVRLAGRLLEYRVNDRINNRLVDIKDPNDPSMSALDIPAGSQIILERFVRLESTGIYGQGPMLTKRGVVFHTPLPPLQTPVEKREFHEKFKDLQKWEASRWGGHQVEEIGGDKALRVIGTKYVPGATKASLIELKHTDTPVDLEQSRRANGGFLSYDTQVKIGFVETAVDPSFGYCPEEPIPCYFAAGLNLRLDGDLNGLGVSLLRGKNGSPYDGIDDGIVPADNRLAVVLWQQIKTVTGFKRKWLAYKFLDETAIFQDDMESGANGWTADGLWHLANHRSSSPDTAWYYGLDSSRNYDTGSSNTGHLVSPEIELQSWAYINLVFNSWHKTEVEDPVNRDLKTVEISVFEAGSWSGWNTLYTLDSSTVNQGLWLQYRLDLSGYAGKKVRIRFTFDTVSNEFNDYEGWYIDDVKLVGNWPVDKSTILVRLVEAASLDFNNGSPAKIEAGDRVKGQSSGASGIVVGPAHISGGSWNDGDAQGSIWLQNTVGNFTNGENILVVGKGQCATAGAYQPRTNLIRVFLGTQDPVGTPNNDPFDIEKHANPRGQNELNWPPEDGQPWTADIDYFTLIKWDTINSAVATVSIVGDNDYPDTIVKSVESIFFSPANGLPERAEIGLHTFGDGSKNTYFDDFGLQADVPLEVSVGPPIQQ